MRGGLALPELSNRKVILVKDGIAMGFIMQAAVILCEKAHPANLIIASPVGSPEVTRALHRLEAVDEAVVFKQPQFFHAVHQAYEHYHCVNDHEVLNYLKRGHRENSGRR